jgi:hypothetical protein
VPFDLKLPNGKTMKQPGNFMFLTETALYGTNDALLAKGVEADVDGNGEGTSARRFPTRTSSWPPRAISTATPRSSTPPRPSSSPPSRTPSRLW